MTESASSTGSVLSPTLCHFSLTTTNPSLSTPFHLIVDDYGYIYVVDRGNNRVVKLDRNGTLLLVFTTNPIYFDLEDIALDAADQLFVLQSGSVVIFAPNGTQLQTVQPGSPAILNGPLGLVLDSVGDFIVTVFSGVGFLEKISANGSLLQIVTYLPPGTPYSLALDSDENVYFSAPSANQVVQLAPNFTVMTQHTTSDPPLNRPFGLFVASDGSIYIADCGNNRVVQLAANGTPPPLTTPPLHSSAVSHRLC